MLNKSSNLPAPVNVTQNLYLCTYSSFIPVSVNLKLKVLIDVFVIRYKVIYLVISGVPFDP